MRIVLGFLIALVATPTWAEWVKVSESDSIDGYIDPTTIRKNGHLSRVWQLHDWKKRDKDGEMSQRVLIEYDCNETRFRVLSLSFHSEPMAGGELLKTSSKTSDWQFVPPTPVADAIIKLVCAK